METENDHWPEVTDDRDVLMQVFSSEDYDNVEAYIGGDYAGLFFRDATAIREEIARLEEFSQRVGENEYPVFYGWTRYRGDSFHEERSRSEMTMEVHDWAADIEYMKRVHFAK